MQDKKTTQLYQKTGVWVVCLVLLLALSAMAVEYDPGPTVHLKRGRMWFSFNGFGMPAKNPIHGVDKFFKRDYPGCEYSPERNFYHQTMPAMEGYIVSADVNGQQRVEQRIYEYMRYPGSDNDLYVMEDVRRKDNFNMEAFFPGFEAVGQGRAEQEAYGKFAMVNMNLEIVWSALSWSFSDYDDFVIREYYLTNTGDTPIENLRWTRMTEILIGNMPDPKTDRDWNTVAHERCPSRERDDDSFEWDKKKKMFYFRDNIQRDPISYEPLEHSFGVTQNDMGEPSDLNAPDSETHDFRAPQFLTFKWLDHPETKNGEENHVNIIQKFGCGPEENPENRFPSGGGSEDGHRLWLQSNDNSLPSNEMDKKDAMEEGKSIKGGVDYLYEDHQMCVLLSTGPYDIQPGETIKLVLADVGGHADWKDVQKGSNDKDWSENLVDGRDAMWDNLELAEELYESGYQCPKPPPTPADSNNTLIITSLGAGTVKVQWPEVNPDYVDPDYGENDMAGYRLYKSTFDCFGPWKKVADIPVDSVEAGKMVTLEDGLLTYLDTGNKLGSPLFYSITTYDTGHDSWPVDPSQYTNGVPSQESGKVNFNVDPVYPVYQSVDSDFSDKVRVYPNPFRQVSGIPNDDNKLDFVNIPGQCTIRIYTLTGALVSKLDHDDGTGSHEWASTYHADLDIEVVKGQMVNQSFQRIMPGLYIYHIENNVPGHENESFIGKFAVIR